MFSSVRWLSQKRYGWCGPAATSCYLTQIGFAHWTCSTAGTSKAICRVYMRLASLFCNPLAIIMAPSCAKVVVVPRRYCPPQISGAFHPNQSLRVTRLAEYSRLPFEPTSGCYLCVYSRRCVEARLTRGWLFLSHASYVPLASPFGTRYEFMSRSEVPWITEVIRHESDAVRYW